MAKKQQAKPVPQYACRDCAHSYDWHSKAYAGGFILCRCKYDDKSKNGKFCKFLSDPQCSYFKKKE